MLEGQIKMDEMCLRGFWKMTNAGYTLKDC